MCSGCGNPYCHGYHNAAGVGVMVTSLVGECNGVEQRDRHVETLSTREWAERNDYNPEKLFHKVLVLRSCDHWMTCMYVC